MPRGPIIRVARSRNCELMAADQTEPVDIRYDNARRRLEISWADGRESAFGYEFLRWRCPCAQCAGEMGIPGQLQSVTELRPEQFTLSTIELVGLYALRPTWTDGHDTGLFAFDQLLAMTDEAAANLAGKVPARRVER